MARQDSGPVVGRVPLVASLLAVVVAGATVIALDPTAGTEASPDRARTASASPSTSPSASPSMSALPSPGVPTGRPGRPPRARLAEPDLRARHGDRSVLVLLDASRSTDPDGDDLTYRWDLDGDGATDDATGATPRFVLRDRGRHRVVVVVGDGTGRADRAGVVLRPRTDAVERAPAARGRRPC